MDRLPDNLSVTPPGSAVFDEPASLRLPPGRRRIEFQIAAGDAFGADVAETICAGWIQLHGVASNYHQRLRALLHEAFSNALLHGCLEISGFSRQSAQDLFRQEREVSDRLNQEFYARRLITIELAAVDTTTILTVEDEGPGYAFHEIKEPSNSEPCIRGMQLIRKLGDGVAIENQGRRIVVSVAARP